MANQYYSIMTALLELGAFIGALQAGFVADKYSRKKAIGLSLSNFLLNDQFINISICVALGSIWFIIGAIIQTTSFSFAQLVVGRFIGGLGVGLLSAVAPMYISEVAPPNIRGALLAMEGATIVIGIVVMFYIVGIVLFHTPLIYLIFLTLFCIDVWFPIHRKWLELPPSLPDTNGPLYSPWHRSLEAAILSQMACWCGSRCRLPRRSDATSTLTFHRPPSASRMDQHPCRGYPEPGSNDQGSPISSRRRLHVGT